MKKYLLAATGAMALSFSANASAALILTFTGPDSATFENSPVGCTVGLPPCTFADTISFLTPAGMKLVSASISTTRSGAPQTPGDIDFISVLLNGKAFSFGTLGNTDFGGLNPISIIAGGTNTLNVNGKAWGASGSYSGVLSFAAVPEPSTWLMMILGVGIAGAALRRRRQTVKVSYA